MRFFLFSVAGTLKESVFSFIYHIKDGMFSLDIICSYCKNEKKQKALLKKRVWTHECHRFV